MQWKSLLGIFKASQIERAHLQFRERILGVKKTTQTTHIYGERGRTDYQTKRFLFIIKNWSQIVTSAERKCAQYIYNTISPDIGEND